ncbi:MAG: SCO family protein [Flavobacteriaceae bacterium]
MKRFSFKYVGLVLVVLLFGMLFIPKIWSRIERKQVVDSSRSVEAQPLAYLNVSGQAKKVPEFLMLNQDSLWIGDSDYLGKVWVVEFFFTRCPSICPIMNKNMKVIDNRFHDSPNFGIASFTIDPAYDQPKILKAYAETYETQSPNWHFLNGPLETVHDLANQGFNIFAGINPEVAGGFEHQGYFALIDKKGYFRSRMDEYGNPIVYYSGLDNDAGEAPEVDALMQDIELLLKE